MQSMLLTMNVSSGNMTYYNNTLLGDLFAVLSDDDEAAVDNQGDNQEMYRDTDNYDGSPQLDDDFDLDVDIGPISDDELPPLDDGTNSDDEPPPLDDGPVSDDVPPPLDDENEPAFFLEQMD
jgi:hypothetical protein